MNKLIYSIIIATLIGCTQTPVTPIITNNCDSIISKNKILESERRLWEINYLTLLVSYDSLKNTPARIIHDTVKIPCDTIKDTTPVSDSTIVLSEDFSNDKPGWYSDFNSDWNGWKWWGELRHSSIVDSGRYKVLRWDYPKGVYSDVYSGASYQIFTKPVQSGDPKAPFDGFEELYFSYDIYFKEGFQWVLGGKIPGLIGYYIDQNDKSKNGFSARPMWKQNGRIVAYFYHQDQIGEYGDTENWEMNNNLGACYAKSGTWNNIRMRVKMNTVTRGIGNKDGVLEFWFNGVLSYSRKNIRWRNSEDIKIDRYYVTSFFGGGDASWAAVRDEYVLTKNYKAWVK